MKLLEDRIRRDGIVEDGEVLKVDSFLNHQMDVELFARMGEEWARLRETYRLDSLDSAWRALYTAMDLFEGALAEVAAGLGCDCPEDVERVKGYIEQIKAMG